MKPRLSLEIVLHRRARVLHCNYGALSSAFLDGLYMFDRCIGRSLVSQPAVDAGQPVMSAPILIACEPHL
jgi:hypothetical protein